MNNFGILLGLACALMAQAQAPETNLAVLTGKVLENAGKPLSGAKVSLTPDVESLIAQRLPLPTWGGKTVTTDDQGKFEIQGVPVSTYILSAEHEGFVHQPYGGKPGARSGASITVRAGDQISNLVIAMAQQCAISGRIRNKEGAPVPGIAVHALRWTYIGGIRQLSEQGKGGTSDARGEFSISELEPGTYFVYADPKQEIRRLDKIERKVPPTFYPNSLVVRDAVSIDVTPGIYGFADIELRQDAQFTIKGTVLGREDKPPSGAAVLIMNDSDTPVLTRKSGAPSQFTPPYVAIARTNAQGHFELPGVAPGLHRLLAFGGGRVPLNFGAEGFATLNGAASDDEGSMGTADIRVKDEDVDNVQISLFPGGEITRKITLDGSTFEDWLRTGLDRNGTPPAQAQARMSQFSGFVPPVTLIPEQRVSVGGRFADLPKTGSATQKVSPGRYFLSITGASQLYIKALKLGGEDVTGKMLNFAGGTTDLEIIMAQDGGSVDGSLKEAGGKPLSGRTVSLWPVEADYSQINGGARIVISGPDGSFTFYSVRPGQYYLAAFDDLPDPGLGQYPPFLGQFTAGNEYVRVEAKKATSRDVKLILRKDVDRAIAGLPQ